MVEDAGQGCRRRLRASDDDEVERREYLVPRHVLEIDVVSHERCHEVRSVALHVQTTVDPLVCIFGVAALTFFNAVGDQFFEEELGRGIVSGRRCDRHALEVAE